MNPDDISSLDQLSPEQVEMMNNLMAQSGVTPEVSELLGYAGYLGFGINLLYIIIFITTAIGLYKLSKKLGDQYSWLAFIPVVQLYTFIKLAGYNFGKGFALLFMYIILGIIAFTIFMMIGAPLLVSLLGNNASVNSLFIGGFILGAIGGIIFVCISTFFLYNAISKRTGRGLGTTLLMILFPWCMLWIVANKLSKGEEKVSQIKVISEEL